jgi:hypothetical protein
VKEILYIIISPKDVDFMTGMGTSAPDVGISELTIITINTII